MFVKLLTGNRAGQVEEMKYETAKILVDSGRAERFNFDRPEPEVKFAGGSSGTGRGRR